MNIIDVKHITDDEFEMFDGNLKAFGEEFYRDM